MKLVLIALIFVGVVLWAIGTMLEVFNRDVNKLINKLDKQKQIKEQNKKWYSSIYMFRKRKDDTI